MTGSTETEAKSLRDPDTGADSACDICRGTGSIWGPDPHECGCVTPVADPGETDAHVAETDAHVAERVGEAVLGCSCGWRPDYSAADWRRSGDQWQAHAESAISPAKGA